MKLVVVYLVHLMIFLLFIAVKAIPPTSTDEDQFFDAMSTSTRSLGPLNDVARDFYDTADSRSKIIASSSTASIPPNSIPQVIPPSTSLEIASGDGDNGASLVFTFSATGWTHSVPDTRPTTRLKRGGRQSHAIPNRGSFRVSGMQRLHPLRVSSIPVTVPSSAFQPNFLSATKKTKFNAEVDDLTAGLQNLFTEPLVNVNAQMNQLTLPLDQLPDYKPSVTWRFGQYLFNTYQEAFEFVRISKENICSYEKAQGINVRLQVSLQTSYLVPSGGYLLASPFYGVKFDDEHLEWLAEIEDFDRGKKWEIGRFKRILDAACAYNEVLAEVRREGYIGWVSRKPLNVNIPSHLQCDPGVIMAPVSITIQNMLNST